MTWDELADEEQNAIEMELRAMTLPALSTDPENPTALVSYPEDFPIPFDIARVDDKIELTVGFDGVDCRLDKCGARALALALIDAGKNLLIYGGDLPAEVSR